MNDPEAVTIRLTKAQALAAGAVLRGYVAHQQERLGEQAAANPNFRNVRGALDAFEEAVGPLPEQEPGRRGERGARS